MDFTISATSLDDLKAKLQAFLVAPVAAPVVAPAPTEFHSTLPLIGFPDGSVLHPGNAFGTPPTVTTPSGQTLQAMVGTGPDGQMAFVPFVAPAPTVVEGPVNQAADAAFLADVQASGEQQNAQRQAAIDAAAK